MYRERENIKYTKNRADRRKNRNSMPNIVIKMLIFPILIFAFVSVGKADIYNFSDQSNQIITPLPIVTPESIGGAGFRSEQQGLISGYMNQNPPSYWIDVANRMSSKFGFQPTGIWILAMHSEAGDGTCLLNFPKNPGDTTNYSNISFYDKDNNEEYLKAFDDAGIKVYLQVEPNDADVTTLIDLILSRYSNHTSVIGFGIDVEWYKFHTYEDGKPITSDETNIWIQKIKRYNPNYKLFLKHWDKNWMPTNHYKDVIYIDDSQGHECLQGCPNEIMDRYLNWSQSFPDAKVGFQIGYRADKIWWDQYTDPAKTIGDALIANIPNLDGIYWVDFTVNDIFPIKYQINDIFPNFANNIMLNFNYH